MIRRILTVGDSFTYGEELSDRNNSWPIQLGNRIGANVINMGLKGGGNKQMIRKVTRQSLAIIRRHVAVRRAESRARLRSTKRSADSSKRSSSIVSRN